MDSASVPLLQSEFNRHSTIGAFQIGALVSYMLFGVTSNQTYLYFVRFPKDPRAIKFLVAFIWLNDLAHAICIGHSLYTYTIIQYGHPEGLATPPKSLVVCLLFDSIVATSTQLFFTFRIYSLYKSLYIPIVCSAMTLVREIGNLILFVSSLLITSLVVYYARWGWLLTMCWSVTTANDVVITAALVFYLMRHRSDVNPRTKAMVDKLVGWTIETGMLTSFAQMASLACFIANRDDLSARPVRWIVFFEPWIRTDAFFLQVYANSLLASLNSRTALRAMTDISFVVASSGPDPKTLEFASNTTVEIRRTEAPECTSDSEGSHFKVELSSL
ncbi:hypothetical protein R3P38DRAFT_3183920 [Favolaschia claudopus]|uniref:DUF6534 domain-containing protein n=1 Tax=Favolaschia claudopus TaxID=2862362 RepID=A0AAW0CBJ6_9AGAR